MVVKQVPQASVAQPRQALKKKKMDVLPNAKQKRPTGVVRICVGKDGWSANHVPIFCTSCGRPGGYVPQDHCDFAFWLCDRCFETYGAIAHTYAMPDEIFWKKIEDEHQESSDAPLTMEALSLALENPSSPMSKLIRDWQSVRIVAR